MARGAGTGGKENPGDCTGTVHEYIPCETPPDGNEEGGGLRLLVGRSHLSERKSHRKTARLPRNRSGLAVVRKTGEKARKRETKCISAGYQTDCIQPCFKKVRFGRYIISSPLENGGGQQYSGSLDYAIGHIESPQFSYGVNLSLRKRDIRMSFWYCAFRLKICFKSRQSFSSVRDWVACMVSFAS